MGDEQFTRTESDQQRLERARELQDALQRTGLSDAFNRPRGAGMLDPTLAFRRGAVFNRSGSAVRTLVLLVCAVIVVLVAHFILHSF